MKEMDIMCFLEKLSSKDPVPGGGGAAALAGAVGIALGNMVGSLTVGKKKYKDVESDIICLNERAQELRLRLCELIDEDARAFEPLSRAYAISKDDPMREAVMEGALKEAARVPFEIMGACSEAIDIIEEYACKGSTLAISDAGCAATMCKAAMESAALNVYINTKMMKDREYAEELNAKVDEMLKVSAKKAWETYELVCGRLQ